MAVGPANLIPFLRKSHLFRGLDDEQLDFIASRLRESDPCEAGETIVRQGEDGERMFLIYEGQVELTYRRGRDSRSLVVLSSGDCFGEETVLGHHSYLATVKALQPCRLFSLSRRDFLALQKIAPRLRSHLDIAVSSRKLARRTRFSWLQPQEVVYFLARKHPLQLWKALFRPLFVGFVWAGLILLIYLFAPLNALLGIGGLGMLGLLCWAGWNYLDWGNDYYLVTNQRVAWVEKVLGIYDSRQEAPLTTILSVGVETSQLGRALDFGDVIVRTFVGRIVFNEVRHPYEAAALIEGYWTRSREAVRREEMETIQRAIREKIAPPQAIPQPEPASSTAAESIPPASAQRRLFGNFLKVRFEKKGVVTYRKHYIVLILQTWKATLLLVSSSLLAVYFGFFQTPHSLGWFFAALALLGIAWWGYEYVDWSNDCFQVTQDQIFDIDRKPFGREERKVASLDNILSTEYRRLNPLQVLFNYGNVYITVGGTQMVFENVANPAEVQQDIDQRRLARLERKRQAEAAAERERMAEWIAAYHRLSHQPPAPPSPDQEPGEKG